MKQLQQPEGVQHGMCMAVQLGTRSGSGIQRSFVGYEHGYISIWDVVQATLLASKRMHEEPVMALAIDQETKGASS